MRETAPSGIRPNSGWRVRRAPTASPEQSTDAGAQNDFHIADREGQENASEAAEENRQPKHDKIDLGGRIDDGADLGGRPLHDSFRANNME
jgi:hypothetical protein